MEIGKSSPERARSKNPNAANILLIDDDEDIRFSLRAILEHSERHTVFEAASGKQAVEIFKNTPGIEIVLLDIGLQGMNGFEVCRQLRLLQGETRKLYIFALTGRKSDEDKRQAMEAGFDEFITKPWEPNDLVAAIANCKKNC